MCRNTVIYFTEEVRDALHARLATRAGARAATSSSAPPSASPIPRALGLTSPFHFIYRKSQS